MFISCALSALLEPRRVLGQRCVPRVVQGPTPLPLGFPRALRVLQGLAILLQVGLPRARPALHQFAPMGST
jgi:hypothetical protein